MHFSTDYQHILDQIDRIEPIRYEKTRNFIDGAVTRLSPYISRGVISTKQVFERTLARGFDPRQIEKFIQELAWRDYWQQVWIAKGELINEDLRFPQTPVENHGIAAAIVEAKTGIEAIDRAIEAFYETGYLHNHVRMYIASIACNIAQSHWRMPARWMYYHLLDADWASNALSWQWVAGANSRKKYYANQQNINKYCHTRQRNTFLDVDYAEFDTLKTPVALQDIIQPDLSTPLPEKKAIQIQSGLPTLIYNFYNLDPRWKEDIQANRILLLEPSHFEQYPVSDKTIDFILALGKNIEGLQVYAGEFDELVNEYPIQEMFYKEHPLNRHYRGAEESRDWMFEVRGYFPSFFAFWKKCQKSRKKLV